MRCLYLHGFMGSPGSAKALLFRRRLLELGWEIDIPDLNAPDFSTLTVSRVLDVAASSLREGDRGVVIGSSMGGWAAAHFAGLYPERVLGMVLMCPALNMPWLLEERLGPSGLEDWRRSGKTTAEHPGLQRTAELDYGFLVDAHLWARSLPDIRCPTLILHGTRDEDVPFSSSQTFAKSRPNVELVAYQAGHSLEEVVEDVVDRGVAFLRAVVEAGALGPNDRPAPR